MILPHTYGGGSIVEWHDGSDGDLLAAVTVPGGCGAKDWYRVMPNGCQPIAEPVRVTFAID